jgi:Cdc6-like AAA superfamily ATPase
LLFRRARICVKGFDAAFLRGVDEFYRLLDSIGGLYRFECSGGRCSSYIVVEGSYASLLASFPGLRVSDSCSGEGVLLPPPRGSEVGGRSSPSRDDGLGFVLGLSGSERVRMSLSDMYRHVLVVGSTGAGKTHTAARIARCVSELGVGVAVLDWHGEYPSIIGDYGRVLSGKSLPTVDIIVEGLTLEESISALEYALNLSVYQSTLLLALLSAVLRSLNVGEARPVSALLGDIDVNSLRDIIARDNTVRGLADAATQAFALSNAARQSRAESEVWLALIRRLNSIAFSEYADLFRIVGSDSSVEVLEGLVIIDVSSIRSVRVRKLYTLLLLHKLYSMQMRKREPLIVVVDEAHHIIESKTVREIVGEARKYRMGLVAVTHTPQMVPPEVLANFNSIIAHKLSSNDSITLVAQLLGDPRLAEILAKLAPGEAVVRTPSIEPYAVVRVDLDGACV